MTPDIQDLIDMRDAGLRCQEFAREKNDTSGLTHWQNSTNKIQAIILRLCTEDFSRAESPNI